MFDFLCAKLKQIRIKTKHFERKITQSLTFCYLIDINQENMTGLCKKYVCDNKKNPANHEGNAGFYFDVSVFTACCQQLPVRWVGIACSSRCISQIRRHPQQLERQKRPYYQRRLRPRDSRRGFCRFC